MSPPIEVAVKETEPMTAAFIAMKGPYAQIPAAFGNLYGWIVANGYTPSGPAMAVYYTMPDQVPEDQALWELRSQIAEDVAASGPDEQGLGVKRVEAAQVATAMHKGPYEDVGATYYALTAWVAENGYEIVGPYEESYFNDPAETPIEELLTEIRFPVRKT